MGDNRERRRFQRIPFDATTELRQGLYRWPVTLLDLSLKGLLIERPEDWTADLNQDFEAIVHLDRDVWVRMQVELRHKGSDKFGFACRYMDLESVSHLHRLVELNLADSDAMKRELGQLIED